MSIFRYVFCSFFLSFFICYVFLSVCFLFLHVFLSFFLFCLSFFYFISFLLSCFLLFFLFLVFSLSISSFLPSFLSFVFLFAFTDWPVYLPTYPFVNYLPIYVFSLSIHPSMFLSIFRVWWEHRSSCLVWDWKANAKVFLFEDHHPIANMKGCTPIHTLTSRSEGVGIWDPVFNLASSNSALVTLGFGAGAGTPVSSLASGSMGGLATGAGACWVNLAFFKAWADWMKSLRADPKYQFAFRGKPGCLRTKFVEVHSNSLARGLERDRGDDIFVSNKSVYIYIYIFYKHIFVIYIFIYIYFLL